MGAEEKISHPTPVLRCQAVRHFCGKQMYGVERERERKSASCPVDRGIYEEVKAVRVRLRWVA